MEFKRYNNLYSKKDDDNSNDYIIKQKMIEDRKEKKLKN